MRQSLVRFVDGVLLVLGYAVKPIIILSVIGFIMLAVYLWRTRPSLDSILDKVFLFVDRAAEPIIFMMALAGTILTIYL